MAGFDDEIPAGAMDELISADTEDMLPDVPLSAQTPVMSNGSHDPEAAAVGRKRAKCLGRSDA